jgi:TolA-binding protein
MVRGIFKRAYYYTLNPLYKVVKAEAADEARLITREHIQQLEQEITQLSKEVERLKKINLEQQNRIAHQVSTEFVKMYQMIDEIKSDRTDVKLNVTIVDELVKIHQSLEALKYERNGSH